MRFRISPSAMPSARARATSSGQSVSARKPPATAAAHFSASEALRSVPEQSTRSSGPSISGMMRGSPEARHDRRHPPHRALDTRRGPAGPLLPRLFGFEVEFDFPWDESNRAFEKSHAVGETAGRVVMIANGSSRLEIFEYRKPAPRADIVGRANADLGIAHFSIEVRGIAQEYARLAAAGMRFQSELVVQTPTIQMAYGRDPDGNIIELIDFAAGS